MKKNLLILFLGLFLDFFTIQKATSQCTPLQNLPATGIYPSLKLLQYLPEAIIDSSYSTIAYFWLDSIYKVGTDTCPDGKFVIDSATIQTIFGLPDAFSYVLNKPGKTYKGGAKGCMVISGIPKDGSIGVYPLGTTIMYHLFCVPALLPFAVAKTDSIVQYLSIRKYPSGFQESVSYFKKLTLLPNPFADNININIREENQTNSSLEIFNYSGQIIYTETIILNPGNNLITLPVLDLKKGIYTVLIKGQKGGYVGMMVKL